MTKSTRIKPTKAAEIKSAIRKKEKLVLKIRELKLENAKLGAELTRLGVGYESQPANWN